MNIKEDSKLRDKIDIITDYAKCLQRLYFKHERYFDKFTHDDFDGLDNAVGGADLTYCRMFWESDNKTEAMKELGYAYDWFKMMNDKCRRHGWDERAGQRGFDTTKPISAVFTWTALAMMKIDKLKKYMEHEMEVQ